MKLLNKVERFAFRPGWHVVGHIYGKHHGLSFLKSKALSAKSLCDETLNQVLS